MSLRDLWNAAGALTASRLVLAAAMPFFVVRGLGLPAYLVAIATDVVDGAVARRTGTASSAGAAFDGWVDKTLHVNLAWSLAVADRMPDWWMIPWFSREIVQVVLHPILMHGFRTGQGVAPSTSLLGKTTAVLLFVCVVGVFLGWDVTVLTWAVGVTGTLAGLHYAHRHLEHRKDGVPGPSSDTLTGA
jgi:CDP-diacylglycerol--glycerol-3-phosphate 3-phosphatidyltransferase